MNKDNKHEETLWDREFWSQQEVADYFRVSINTVINWRKEGLLSYWRPPGRSRVLYFKNEIAEFKALNTKPRKNAPKLRKTFNNQRVDSSIQNQIKQPDTAEKDWRI